MTKPTNARWSVALPGGFRLEYDGREPRKRWRAVGPDGLIAWTETATEAVEALVKAGAPTT